MGLGERSENLLKRPNKSLFEKTEPEPESVSGPPAVNALEPQPVSAPPVPVQEAAVVPAQQTHNTMMRKTFLISPEVSEKLREMSYLNKRSESEIVREIFEQYFKGTQ